MTTLQLVPGTHVLFARAGLAFTVPSPGTVSATAKPGPTDTSWLNLGSVTEGALEITEESRDIFGPTPGRRRLRDVIPYSTDMKVTFTTEDVVTLAHQLSRARLPIGSNPANEAGAYNPLNGFASVKGWAKVQIYNAADEALHDTMDLWVHLKLGGSLSLGGEQNAQRVSWEARVLFSALNTGTLS